MGAPLNLPLFPYPLMFAFNNELKDPSFSFSLLFTLISRSTLGGNTMRFFQTCRGIMHITHLFPLILLYGLHFPLCFALPSFKKNWTVLCLFCVIHGQFIRWLAVYKGFNFIKIDALLFYTFSLSLTAHYTINYLLPTSNITWNAPRSTSQAHELSDDSAQHEALHTAADPLKKT
jgi:hypothetical protein